jgi:hypothetical protein
MTLCCYRLTIWLEYKSLKYVSGGGRKTTCELLRRFRRYCQGKKEAVARSDIPRFESSWKIFELLRKSSRAKSLEFGEGSPYGIVQSYFDNRPLRGVPPISLLCNDGPQSLVPWHRITVHHAKTHFPSFYDSSSCCRIYVTTHPGISPLPSTLPSAMTATRIRSVESFTRPL